MIQTVLIIMGGDNMVPGRYDITIYEGGTFNVGITAKNSDGTAMSFTGYTSMAMQIRPPWALTETQLLSPPLLELTLANGGLVVSGDGETLSLLISAATTERLTFTEGWYDLEMVVTADGEDDIVDKLLYGKVSVKKESTI